KVDIKDFKLLNKRMTGQTLKFFFIKHTDNKVRKVLELKNIAAFIDTISDQELISLIIDDNCGSYGFDISIHLNRSEIQNFKEVFLFADRSLTNCVFHALSEHVTWRDFDSNLMDINY